MLWKFSDSFVKESFQTWKVDLGLTHHNFRMFNSLFPTLEAKTKKICNERYNKWQYRGYWLFWFQLQTASGLSYALWSVKSPARSISLSNICLRNVSKGNRLHWDAFSKFIVKEWLLFARLYIIKSDKNSGIQAEAIPCYMIWIELNTFLFPTPIRSHNSFHYIAQVVWRWVKITN